jgi:sterol desaturase/sphingolipid hydroxylase (fatty acid hydroxylase superfamily)
MIPSIAVSITLGAISWTLLEYVLHRWLGHDRRTRPNPFAAEHVRHHSEGDYFAPAHKKLLAAAAVMLILSGPAVAAAGIAQGLSFVAGLIAMYGLYEVLHRRDHTHPGVGRYMRFLRRHHFYHHFVDPSTNHGVTSPVWDWVFGTLRAPGVIKVPRKLAMRWLTDRITGQVLPEFAQHYELAGGASSRSRGHAPARKALASIPADS